MSFGGATHPEMNLDNEPSTLLTYLVKLGHRGISVSFVNGRFVSVTVVVFE